WLMLTSVAAVTALRSLEAVLADRVAEADRGAVGDVGSTHVASLVRGHRPRVAQTDDAQIVGAAVTTPTQRNTSVHEFGIAVGGIDVSVRVHRNTGDTAEIARARQRNARIGRCRIASRRQYELAHVPIQR